MLSKYGDGMRKQVMTSEGSMTTTDIILFNIHAYS